MPYDFLHNMQAISMPEGWTAVPCLAVVAVFGTFIFQCLMDTLPRTVPSSTGKGLKNRALMVARLLSSPSRYGRKMIFDAISKFISKGRACIIYNLTEGFLVVLPTCKTPWLFQQNDKLLSMEASHDDLLQHEYTCPPAIAIKGTKFATSIRRGLVRKNFDSTIPQIEEELIEGFNKFWGSDTNDWRHVGVYLSMMEIVGRTTNRMLVGLPLCRNKTYLRNSLRFTHALIPTASIVRAMPAFLRPILGSIIALPSKYFYRQFSKSILPVINQRLASLDRDVGPEETPEDFLSWQIQDATQNKQDGVTGKDLPATLCSLAFLINFAAIHTTVLTASAVILSLASSDPSKAYLTGIREEVESVLAEENGQWSQNALDKMYRVDSIIRETMRLHSPMAVGLTRTVMKGFTLKEDGSQYNHAHQLNPGNKVAIPVRAVHTDPANYRDPLVFDAFRFCPDRLEENKNAFCSNTTVPPSSREASTTATAATAENTPIPMSTTSATFLGFGNGKHACPGRFFATMELKLLIAYMTLNYEIQPLSERPEDRWMGSFVLPNQHAKLWIRRRAAVVGAKT